VTEIKRYPTLVPRTPASAPTTTTTPTRWALTSATTLKAAWADDADGRANPGERRAVRVAGELTAMTYLDRSETRGYQM